MYIVYATYYYIPPISTLSFLESTRTQLPFSTNAIEVNIASECIIYRKTNTFHFFLFVLVSFSINRLVPLRSIKFYIYIHALTPALLELFPIFMLPYLPIHTIYALICSSLYIDLYVCYFTPFTYRYLHSANILIR